MAIPTEDPTRRRTCSCSPDCRVETMSIFAPGHDARLVSRLTKAVVAGEMTSETALQTATDRGGSEALIAKLRKTIENAATKPTVNTSKALAHLVGTTIPVQHGARTFHADVVEVQDLGVVARHRLSGDNFCLHNAATGEKLAD